MSEASYRTIGLSVPVSEVLSPALWRERYAYGLNLGQARHVTLQERVCAAQEGAPLRTLVDTIPDHVIRWHLRAALSELEVKLGTPMGIEVVKTRPVDDGLVQGVDYDRVAERLPYTRGETLAWFKISLPPGVISVERVRAYYFDRRIWSFEGDALRQVLTEWPRQGEIHIMPYDLQAVLVLGNGMAGAGTYGVWETINLQTSPVPGFWAVDYTRGPVSRDGQVGQIEAVLAHWVYCAAGILLLSQAGLAQSRGLTSTSVSMDGVSRSVSLQASAIYGLNSALEHAYDEAMKRVDWRRLRAAKRGIRLFPYSY